MGIFFHSPLSRFCKLNQICMCGMQLLVDAEPNFYRRNIFTTTTKMLFRLNLLVLMHFVCVARIFTYSTSQIRELAFFMFVSICRRLFIIFTFGGTYTISLRFFFFSSHYQTTPGKDKNVYTQRTESNCVCEAVQIQWKVMVLVYIACISYTEFILCFCHFIFNKRGRIERESEKEARRRKREKVCSRTRLKDKHYTQLPRPDCVLFCIL